MTLRDCHSFFCFALELFENRFQGVCVLCLTRFTAVVLELPVAQRQALSVKLSTPLKPSPARRERRSRDAVFPESFDMMCVSSLLFRI